ncbi:MAG: hypothetical protein WC536_00730 [Patescibacteria group bacterium]
MNKDDFFKLKPAMSNSSPSLNSFLILEEAINRGIQSEHVEGSDFFILRHNDKVRTLRIDNNSLGFSSHAVKILNDKHQTKIFLKRAGLSVSSGVKLSVSNRKSILDAYEQLTKPLVVKPANDTYGGECVMVNIEKASDLLKKVGQCKKRGHREVIVEEQFVGGLEYRILASRNNVVGIICRVPANVIGDGKHTVKELIEIKNSDSRRGGHDYKKPLLKIEIDNVVRSSLKNQRLSLNSVISSGKQIFLRSNSNLSTGGDSIDCTDIAHSSVKEIAIKAINSIPELPYGGVDFITKDITKEQTKDSYAIIEINASPMISMHHFPYKGKPRNVAKEIIDIVFPEIKGKTS